ncbi:MAG: imidazoleglycerol-phosphate dehydratase HisB [Planctomycetota bacterium]|nr:MAG: imidazoleglycerol-phosphate dehydratase HisB [Planctomycetota bacterium]
MTTKRPTSRTATITRATRETDIRAQLSLDGSGTASIRTGLGFFDHMLTALATHARIDLDLACKGDLHVDDHHTVEDCALVLGQALDEALGDRRGIARFGSAYAPLDESLCRVVIDLSGRPSSVVALGFSRELLGDVATENLSHFFTSFAIGARCTLHVDCLRGENDHHRAEAAFKALALALRQAVAVDAASDRVPSTKGTLS